MRTASSPTEADTLSWGQIRTAYVWPAIGCRDGNRGQGFGDGARHAAQRAKYILKDGVYYPNHKATDILINQRGHRPCWGEMGFRALNLSISWARIYPYGCGKGRAPEKAWECLPRCATKSAEIMASSRWSQLYKYDMPAFYIEDWGGWSNRKLIDEYVEFARVC